MNHRRTRERNTPLFGLAHVRPAAAAAFASALVAAAFLLRNPLQVALILCLVLLAVALSRKSREARPYIVAALSVAVFIAILNPLFSRGGLTVLWHGQIGPLDMRITLEGVLFGLGEGLRLATVIVAFSLFSIVIDPDDQLALISRISFRSGLVLSLATRMFPVLSRDAAHISDAQRSRGAELDRGRRRERAAARLPLLRALITQSLERSLAVAASMEARGFGCGRRTQWSPYRERSRADLVFFAAVAAFPLPLIAGLATGAFAYQYFPLADNPLPGMANPWWWALFALLSTPLLLQATWQRWRTSTR
jgi:energy-coupling factor transport system permease protein